MSDIEEQRRAQEQMQDHQSNLAQAQNMAPSFGDRREYLEAVIDDELDNATVQMLHNMTSPDFILSNLENSEINEIKKLREITIKKVFASHPHPKAVMQGAHAAQVYDQDGAPNPLDAEQKVLIEEYVRGAFARLARSRDGFQQEQFGKTISASERKTGESEDGGWLSFS